MGFFSHAFVIEGTVEGDEIALSITALSTGGPTLFSWGPGTRPSGLTSLGDGTLFCADAIRALPGYPRIDKRPQRDPSGEVYIEENFFPYVRNEPVLFHVILPPRYVLRPNRTPFTLTPEANIALKGDRLFFTWPTVGGGDLRFWIAPLGTAESFENYQLSKLLSAPVTRAPKLSFELNFGIAKVKVG